ncbi:MAG: N-acetylmuramoyl-L-alanine amidase protein [uncultured bacterium]|nr:MAG: N-acetylmuramoyl-L-alanine amidase protein [uncultured bacterium]KKT74669.1 MAG: N-acetylmuramoyl-L-alanine amidase domain protein [Candidatus Peregrinibacteria bacterium GW2011_GWA2_44_7]
MKKSFFSSALTVSTLAQFLVLTLFVTTLSASMPNFARPEFEDGGVRASTLHTHEQLQLPALSSASINGTPAAYENKSQFLSPIYTTDFPFGAVVMTWEENKPQGTEIEFSVRFQLMDEVEWTQWQDIHADIDDKAETFTELKEFMSQEAFITTKRSQSIQYRVQMSSDEGKTTPRFRNVDFQYIDAEPTNLSRSSSSPAKTLDTTALDKLTFGGGSADVISRSEWGAEESWRLSSYFGVEEAETDDTATEEGKNGENPELEELYPEEFKLSKVVSKDAQGNALYWPLQYAENIKKIFIHHTATTGNLDNPQAAIRAIYYYHTVSRGWGDIGYNYIIDPQGNIYEGRYGGEKVVGGHTRGYNTGSIGISVLGNYQESEVPYPVLEALSRLIGEKGDLYDIQVDGFGQFRGEVTPNVMGHRDAASTACPGQYLYDKIPALRQVISGIQDNKGTDSTKISNAAYSFANVNDYDALQLKPQQSNTIEIKLKNTGQTTWNSKTYLVANQNVDAEALVHLKKETGNVKSIAPMNEKEVKSGELATFTIEAQAYLSGGFQNFEFTPVFNGSKKLNEYLILPVYISSPVLRYQLRDIDVKTSRIKAGKTFPVTIEIENTGDVSWSNSDPYPLKLGTANPQDRVSSFLSGDANRYGTLQETLVAPGDVGHFTFTLTAPKKTGHYTEYLQPVFEGVGWLDGPSIQFGMSVYDNSTQAELGASSQGTVLEAGKIQNAWIELKNIGDKTWNKTGQNKLTVGIVKDATIGVTKLIVDQKTLKPGKTGHFDFKIKAPTKPGTYTILLKPRLAGQNIVKNPIKFVFTVAADVDSQEEMDQQNIRIKLGYDEGEFGDPVITANGAFALEIAGKSFLELKSGEEVTVHREDDRYRITHDSSAWVVENFPRFVPKNEEVILEIKNYENRPGWNQNLNDNRFRGVLEIRQDESALIAINELSLKHYLGGLAEISNTDHVEKIRTMVVLARTYAAYYISGKQEKFPGKPYDGSDNPDEFQKYLGYGLELRAPNVVKAVAATKNKVVTYKGELVKTPYFNSSPGYTLSAEDVWGWTDTPYLIGVEDFCEGEAKGHQVGLSGCGATFLAESGKKYEEIILYYYAGVAIETR